jgi:sugar lactone lactonase YvrE
VGDPAVEVVVNDRAGHAESPLWSPRERALYWVDTRNSTIYRLSSSGRRSSWIAPARLGAIGLWRDGLIVAAKDGMYLLNTMSGAFRHIVDAEPERSESRINDAKVDRAGRFWFGSQEDYGRTPTGCLYRLDGDGSYAKIDDGYLNPNGFAWSPDNRRLYAADTKLRTIHAYDFDHASGAASNRRTFAEIPADEGTPDGATVDSAGYVWAARNGGGAVVRYAPDGTIERRVALPATHVTNATLGGDDLRTLFISTAWATLTTEHYWNQPLAGAILSLRVDVPGLPEVPFAGG